MRTAVLTMFALLLCAATWADCCFMQEADGTIKRSSCKSDWAVWYSGGRDCIDADLADYYVMRVDTIPVIDTAQVRAGVNIVYKDVPRLDTTWAPLVTVKLHPDQIEVLLNLLEWATHPIVCGASCPPPAEYKRSKKEAERE